jgi:hypothetical protein
MLRVPDPFDLAIEPQLGPLALLELAAAVAVNALRAYHVQIHGDPMHDELDEATAARRIVSHCNLVLRAIQPYRRHVLERLERDQASWFESDDE